MGDPLSIAGLIVSLSGLFTSCLQIYDLISTAASHGPDFQVMLCKIEVEQLRFFLWGETMGLIPSSTSTSSGVDLRIAHPHINTTIARVFSCIQQIFHDTEKLKKRYGLVPGEGKSLSLPGSSMQLYGKSSPTFPSLSMFKGIYERQQSAAVETQKQNGALKKARWAIADKDKFNAVIGDLRGFNDSLNSLLPDVQYKTQERLRQQVLASQDENASEGIHTDLNRTATIKLSRLNTAPAAYGLPVINSHDFSDTSRGTWDITTSLRRASGQVHDSEPVKVEKQRSKSYSGAATLAGPWDQDEHIASGYMVELPAGDLDSGPNISAPSPAPSPAPKPARRKPPPPPPPALPPSGWPPLSIRKSIGSLRTRARTGLEVYVPPPVTKRDTLDVPTSPDVVYLAGMCNLLDSPNLFGGEVNSPLSATISELSVEPLNRAPSPWSGSQRFSDPSPPPLTPDLTEVFYICIDFQDYGTRAAIAHTSAPEDSNVVGGWPDGDTCDSYIQSAWVPPVLVYESYAESGTGCRWGYQVDRAQEHAKGFIAHLSGEKTGLMAYLERHGKTLQMALEEYFDHLLRHVLEAANIKYGHDAYIASGIECTLIVSKKWDNSVCTPLRNAVQNALFSFGINSDVALQVDASLAASYVSAGLFIPELKEQIRADGNLVEGNEDLFMVCHVGCETQKAITIQTFQAQPRPNPEATTYHPPQFSAVGIECIFREFEKYLERNHEYTRIRSEKPYHSAQGNWLSTVLEFTKGPSVIYIGCPYYPDCYECPCSGGTLSMTKGQMEGILNGFFAEVCAQVREGLKKLPKPAGKSKVFKGIYLCGEFGSRCNALQEYLRKELPEQSVYPLPQSATEIATGATIAALKHGLPK
ncbi:hypothetical protein L873DRAFT_1829838 [Choiromyces venosus 120613-1]|uniref:Prion-inhibition and propagation HeLo domain-containing protein n=1 Tax=Choiromyces venosus 120613-1 TaxID=1336337 RepID=A0A3N4JAS8_9PEZI|nr:hypothetical protein L873DRAFT_1829838 [Choiromyces venosus 120613-1]